MHEQPAEKPRRRRRSAAGRPRVPAELLAAARPLCILERASTPACFLPLQHRRHQQDQERVGGRGRQGAAQEGRPSP